jgi:putative transposase
MSDVGACWDNAVVERFFGILKHDWILKVRQPTREHMKLDVAHYIRYYNNDRSHTANGDLSPVKYEVSQLKVSDIGWPEQFVRGRPVESSAKNGTRRRLRQA